MHRSNGFHAFLFGKSVNPTHLKTFLAVEKHRNYTHAAKELFLSQPAVSRQVRQLEDELGVRLFEQIGKTLSLTDAGRTLSREAKRLLGDMERVAEAVKAHRTAERGTLRLGASTTPGIYLLPPILGTFHRKYPDVELSYTVENSLRIEERILKNELDMGFVGAHLSSQELHLEPVIEDEIVFFASPSHPLAGRRRIQLKSLAKETWVVRERGSATRELLESRLVSSGAKIGRAITLESPEAVKAVVAGGFGFSFLSIHGLRDDIKRGRLKKLSVSGFRLKRPIYYVRHLEKHTSPVIEAFLSLAQATF